MFDTIDAALYYPPRGNAYFFKGRHYMSYRPGHGIVLLSGREVRTIGVDGWRSFPEEFRRDLDAALFYPPNGHAYFFKGAQYIKYRPSDEAVVPTSGGQLIRTIADHWSFPAPFASGIDAAVFHRDNNCAYFFKNNQYLKYNPVTESVEPTSNGSLIRTIGQTGWRSFPEQFQGGVDAAMDYPPNEKLYFFRGRDYIRWEPGGGLDKHYPRRIGLLHRDHGGWPGLSHIIAGPMVGPLTDTTARIWLWLTNADAVDRVEITLNGASVSHRVVDPVNPQILSAVDDINTGSLIRVLELTKLSPATNYSARVTLGGVKLDEVTFTTAPAPSAKGKVTIAFGSCADMSKTERAVPTFEAMHEHQPDLALFCGDNCYYANKNGTTSLPGSEDDRPRDWESAERMLRRQIEARNHPQFNALSRSIPLYATWDDHDFGYNNANGTDLTNDWVGRQVAASVFRAMWPNPYRRSGTDQPIHYSFRWGPVEIFMTDSRFNRKVDDPPNPDENFIWGSTQLDWLVDSLANSQAPLKIVVVACQFLFGQSGNAGHFTQAKTEREAILNHIRGVAQPVISGRVLFLSGDMHYSELQRFPTGQGAATTIEFTSSPIRRNNLDGNVPQEARQGCRVWAAQQNGFGIVTVDIQSNDADKGVQGTVTFEAWGVSENDRGVITHRLLITDNNQDCRSTWDLATGNIT